MHNSSSIFHKRWWENIKRTPMAGLLFSKYVRVQQETTRRGFDVKRYLRVTAGRGGRRGSVWIARRHSESLIRRGIRIGTPAVLPVRVSYSNARERKKSASQPRFTWYLSESQTTTLTFHHQVILAFSIIFMNFPICTVFVEREKAPD